ncbi:GvpL/GvpF family gas vesicle protein [Myxococcus sp. CA056]|uniref:GvpL/GvpF family gas vesicle protein n=1 Tax=unclassified Myxococcus TaxID=2648731 RepID=UPI00157A3415|nr:MULTISPECIES: GvpL/GvpF family gas vesicle protein [unclassified Myxococcus]NTX15149.1 GvpL/GvpF family gas vesicle protein [Myxococcus sp. CA056]NTX36147.1 GvpL/GvpF family gas vesicle protein [Myxococcus sp. CA033]
MPRTSRPPNKSKASGRRGAPARKSTPARKAPRRTTSAEETRPPAPPPPREGRGKRNTVKNTPKGKPRARVTRTQEELAGPHYLYGVVRTEGPLDFGPIGLGMPPAHVHAVREGALVALVSSAPARVVDPTRANLLAHQRAAEVVLREHTLLPVAFGTVLGSEAEVRRLLRSAQDALTRTLVALEGKVELGLKVLYHREHLARRMEFEDAGLRRRENELETEHERRLGQAVELRASLDMAAMLEGLHPLANATRTDAPVGERMLLNAAFLVTRDAVPDFEARVRMLAARSDLYAFRFTGPWAPYSFVDVRLGLDDSPETPDSRRAR